MTRQASNGACEWEAFKKLHFPFLYKCFGFALAFIILGFTRSYTANTTGLTVCTSILAVMLLIRLKKLREVYLYGHKVVATATSMNNGFYYGKSANLEACLNGKKFDGILYPTKGISLPGVGDKMDAYVNEKYRGIILPSRIS